MWKRCHEGLSGPDCATRPTSGSRNTRYIWDEALQLVETLNGNGGFAGYTDWRLPNIKELASIVEVQCIYPAINTTVFPATANGYWSASPFPDLTSTAWSVGFSSGHVAPADMIVENSVRLVRGGL